MKFVRSDMNVTDPVDEHGDEGNGNEYERNSPDVTEFVAFICWYLFLILCCVVPTICAYRRRRNLLFRDFGAAHMDPALEMEERMCSRMEKEKRRRLLAYFIQYKKVREKGTLKNLLFFERLFICQLLMSLPISFVRLSFCRCYVSAILCVYRATTLKTAAVCLSHGLLLSETITLILMMMMCKSDFLNR